MAPRILHVESRGSIVLVLAVVVSLAVGFGVASAGTNVSGTLYGANTWALAGSPYVLTDHLWVAAGATLDVQPGVVVQRLPYYEIIVCGSLTANGAAFNCSVVSLGSGTIQMTGCQIPMPDGEVMFLQGTSGSLDGCSGRNAYLQTPNVTVTDCTFDWVELATLSGGAVVTGCTLGRVVYYGVGSGDTVVTGCTFTGEYPIYRYDEGRMPAGLSGNTYTYAGTPGVFVGLGPTVPTTLAPIDGLNTFSGSALIAPGGGLTLSSGLVGRGLSVTAWQGGQVSGAGLQLDGACVFTAVGPGARIDLADSVGDFNVEYGIESSGALERCIAGDVTVSATTTVDVLLHQCTMRYLDVRCGAVASGCVVTGCAAVSSSDARLSFCNVAGFLTVTDASPLIEDCYVAQGIIPVGNSQPVIVNRPVNDGFETGDLRRLKWRTTGDGKWAARTTSPWSGVYSAASPVLATGQAAAMEATVNSGAGYLTFFRKGATAAGYDYLRFSIDGVVKAQWNGTFDWDRAIIPVEAGRHVLRFEYQEGDAGGERVYVDDVAFPAR